MSAIEWTDETWNPVTGCDRVSPGCAHCYALDLAPRLRAMGNAKYRDVRDGGRASGPAFGVTLHPGALGQPLRWRKPRRVFVNSMSDLFHDEIPDDYIARVFAVMAACPEHTFQVLTKRPERMQALVGSQEFEAAVYRALDGVPSLVTARRHQIRSRLFRGVWITVDWPLPNVWLGVSIENRRFVDRADLLRQTPAAVRFISAEPLLGPLVHDIPDWLDVTTDDGERGRYDGRCDVTGAITVHLDGDPLNDPMYPPVSCDRITSIETGEEWAANVGELDLRDIDWLIVGGESGRQARRCDPRWVRALRDLAAQYACAFFFKQWGGRTPKAGGRELDGRTWDEFPAPGRGSGGGRVSAVERAGASELEGRRAQSMGAAPLAEQRGGVGR